MKIIISESQLKLLIESQKLNSNKFYIEYGGKWISIPKHITNLLKSARTPEEIESIIADKEQEIADFLDPDMGYLWCDHTAQLMHQVLKYKKIPHQVVVGTTNDNIQSHSYIKVGNKRYDPTKQGFGDCTIEKIEFKSDKNGYSKRVN